MSLRKNPRFDLKRSYHRIFSISIIVSLFVLIAAFKFVPEFKAGNVYIEPPQGVIKTTDIVPTQQNKFIPPPPKPAIPIEAPLDMDIPDVEINDTDIDYNVNLPKKPEPYKDSDPVVENVYFEVVEENPTPVGGLASIAQELEYPAFAIRTGVYGTVLVYAYVDENGDVVKAEVRKGIGAGCDEAAMEAVMKTKFNPGKQRGKPVKVKVTVPVKFVFK